MRWPVLRGAAELPSTALRVPVDLALDKERPQSAGLEEALRLAGRISTVLEAQADVLETLAQCCVREAKLQGSEDLVPNLLLSNVKLLAEEGASQASEKAREVRKLAGVDR